MKYIKVGNKSCKSPKEKQRKKNRVGITKLFGTSKQNKVNKIALPVSIFEHTYLNNTQKHVKIAKQRV